LQRYQGDEKIKTFIWDLIKPRGVGEDSTIARNHSGLHNLVPRGRNAKGSGVWNKFELMFSNFWWTLGRKGNKPSNGGSGKEPESAGPSSPRASSSASSTISVMDDTHWSKDDKYDAESYLESTYKKHLTRHANK
jgi:chromodomain-helicase-DNA-binding protein 7